MLARFIVRMGFAGEDDLNPTKARGDALETRGIGQQKTRPLVGNGKKA